MQQTPFHPRRVLALVTCLASLAVTAVTAHAVPGDITPGSKLVYSFNLIGYPDGRTYEGGCGNGHRIFVNRDAKGAQLIVRNSAGGWDITDCNATIGKTAELRTSDVGTFDIYVRILGKPGGHIRACVDTLADALAGEILCQVGVLELTRTKGQSKFQLAPSAIFDASNIDLLWTIDTNADYRIAQFRVYQRP